MLKKLINPLITQSAISMKQQHIIKSSTNKITLLSSIQYKFSQQFQRTTNPNQIPQQVKKLLKQQQQQQKQNIKKQQLPLLKDISQLKTIQQVPEIFKKMVFLTKQQRQIVIRYLLSAIYQHKLPFQTLMLKSMDVNLTQFSHLKLQTEIYKINYLIHEMQRAISPISSAQQQQQHKDNKQQSQKQVTTLSNQINDLYYTCFNTTLKAIPIQHLPRSKATLYKHFAEYNFNHLFNNTITDNTSSLYEQNKATLKKARQFLIQSLLCHKQIILTEQKKLQSPQIKKLKEQNLQRYQIKLSAIKQNLRKLVQSIGECLYAIFKILNKQHKLLKDPFQHRNRKIQLLSLIDTYIPLYSIIPGIKQLSMMYYKLYKIKIQANYTAVGQPKTQQQLKKKVKQTVQQYNRLYKQCQQCLQQSIKIDKFASIKEISTTILSIKFMIGKTAKQSQSQIKNSLAIQAKSIIDKMKKQYKQPVQQYMLQLIKEMLNIKA